MIFLLTNFLGLSHLFHSMMLGMRGPKFVASKYLCYHKVLVHLQKIGILHEDAVFILQILIYLPFEIGQQLLQQFLNFVPVGEHGRLALTINKVEG